MKIAVLGGGVSGVTIARLLYDQGFDVTVYEAGSSVGGLLKSCSVNGYLYDKHGAHVFNSKKTEITDWVFSLLPKNKWKFNIRNAKIFFDDKYISYPFELSLYELPIEKRIDCLCDFIDARQGEKPKNFYDWIIWNFGKTIANYYMLPYNKKIWAYPLRQMNADWMNEKMPLIDKRSIVRSLITEDSIERKMSHSTFYYPLEGAIQPLVDTIARPLTVFCNQPILSCEKSSKAWCINGNSKYDMVINTIPLTILSKTMSLPYNVQKAISNLKYNSLTTILFSCPSTDITWLYIPSKKYKAHRVVYHSSFSQKIISKKNTFATLEIIGSKCNIKKNFLKTVLPPELNAKSIIDKNFAEYAYVIFDKNYCQNTSLIKRYFSSQNNFYLSGKWGCWNYDNIDVCMYKAFILRDRIINKYQ